jgi:GMP synthase (glutamine-hydrolysing)
LLREGHCHRRMAKDVKPTPQARGVLRRFVRHAATLRGH